jgi:hypothetical protein
MSCKSADNKVPQMAADICNCFADIEKKMSKETKTIFANAADTNSKLQDEISKLTKDEQARVLTEMTFFNEIDDENSTIGECIKNAEKKYGYYRTGNKKKLEEKILRELESKKGCEFTTSVWKLGFKRPD